MNEIIKVCKKHGDLTLEQTTKDGKYRRCQFCRIEKDRKWKSENRDKHRATAGVARKLNRDKANEWAKQDRKNNPEKYREWQRNSRIKQGSKRITNEILRERTLSREVYEEMLKHYDNKCAICRKEENRKSRTPGKICRLAIDHCHTTNDIRGLLCHACNTAIGKFKDSIELLESAIQYLKTAGCWRNGDIP